MSKRVYTTKPRLPLRSMPSTLMIIGDVKLGKTTIEALMTTQFAPGKALLVTLGKEAGADNLAAVEEKCPDYRTYENLMDDLISDQPYDFVIYDNLSVVNDWAETAGTISYMKSTMGKNYNLKARDTNPTAKGPGLNSKTMNLYYLPGDPNFKSVYLLPDGNGYAWARPIADRWYHKMKESAEYVIMNGHKKVNRFTTDDDGKRLNTEHLDMVKGIATAYCKDVDVLASMYAKKNERYLSFQTNSGDTAGGSRYDYLADQVIKISEKTDKGIVTYWETIYPDYKLINQVTNGK